MQREVHETRVSKRPRKISWSATEVTKQQERKHTHAYVDILLLLFLFLVEHTLANRIEKRRRKKEYNAKFAEEIRM